MNATWNKDAKYSFLFNLISDKYKEEWFLI